MIDVVVINLDRDTGRLAHMRTQLARCGLAFRRFSAIEGAALPTGLSSFFDRRCKALSAGEIGCYASHLAICQEIVACAAARPTLVLEDDVELPPTLAQTLQRVIAVLPVGWDIVRLSYPSKRAVLSVAHLGQGYELIRYSQAPVSTGAYLLSQSGALKMLAPRARDLPIDHDLRRVWAWKLKTYGVSPPPVRADTMGTSSIDLMAPGERAEHWRTARIKRRRITESLSRFVYGMRDFGMLRWCAIDFMNVACRLLPRQSRANALAWASRAFGWRTESKRAPPLSHIHAVGGLTSEAHALQRRTLRRGGRP